MDQFDRSKRKMARYTRLASVTICSIPPFLFLSMSLDLGGEYLPVLISFIIILLFTPYKMHKIGNELRVFLEEKYENGVTEDDYKRVKQKFSNLFKKSAVMMFASLGIFVSIFFFPYNPRYEWSSLIVAMSTFITCSIGIHDSYKGNIMELEKSHMENVKKQNIDRKNKDVNLIRNGNQLSDK